MKKILEELWYGNIIPGERGMSAEEKRLARYLADHHESLCEALNEEQRKALESFDECSSELSGIREREAFIYAFRLGARIAIEVMSAEL